MANPVSTHSLVAASSPAPTMLQAGTGHVLTVGAGMEFSTLSDALKASSTGDTIAVQAGTYTNDFATVDHAVNIVAVGGIVNEVANTPPPNGKALLTVDANLNIQGFTFTGGSDGNFYGNISGIRLEAGNLDASYCYFHDMEDGLLANGVTGAAVTIDHCEFYHNGTGDGLTHNLYVGAVASLTVTNSYFHDAVVGHEIKSRAAVTTITNNVIADGPDGTGSYDIDIPNAGVAKISGNIIEKGALASNWPVIHYGGETNLSWATNALSVTGNTIDNDFGPLAEVVLNASNYNGPAVNATVSGNILYGFNPASMLVGAGTLSGNIVPSTEPGVNVPVTWSAVPMVAIAAGTELLNLANGNHVVAGGQARLAINDTFGSNTITGGAGGLTLNVTASWDQLATKAGASDAISLTGRNNVLHSAGNDRITVTASSLYNEIDATGAATIASAGFGSFDLAGTGEQLTTTNSAGVTVDSTGSARLIDMAGDIKLSVAAGGHVAIADQAAIPQGGAASGATVTGAISGWIQGSGVLNLTTGDSGALVRAGNGQVNVTGGAGVDSICAGSGSDVFTLGCGNDQVMFGSGSASVTGGTGTETYRFRAGSHGHDTIVGFKQGTDALRFDGFTGTAVASGTVSGGSTTLTLTDGTTVLFTGVALSGYGPPSLAPTPTPPTSPAPPTPAPPAPAPPAPAPPAPAPGQPASGNVSLTSGGHVLTGGNAPLSVTDYVGGNTIAGGIGGLSIAAGWNDLISTQAGATDQITLTHADTLTGAGNDTVAVNSTADAITEQGNAQVSLAATGTSVQGGAGLLRVTDVVGSNTIVGGAGGLSASLAGTYDSVTTAGGAADMVGLSGYSTLLSQGSDQITVQGLYDQVTVTGASAITSASASSTFNLEGADSLTASGGLVTVGSAAAVTVACTGAGDVGITKLAGGTLSASTVLPEGVATLNLSGGAATVSAATGLYASLTAATAGGVSIFAGAGTSRVVSQAAAGGPGDTVHGGAGNLTVTSGAQGIDLVAGSGNVTLNGGSGNDIFMGGAGQAQLSLGAGQDSVTLGSGSVTVQGSGSDTFIVPGGAIGTLVVQNWSAQDTLVTPGATHAGGGTSMHDASITSQSVVNGSTWLTIAGGAQVELLGVTHFG